MTKFGKPQIIAIVLAALIFAGVIYLASQFKESADQAEAANTLKVMSYSSFLNAWGPGPEVARRFQEETGIRVEFHDAGDAGLIIEKLKLFPADVVIGLDQFSLSDARAKHQWRQLQPSGAPAGSGSAPGEASASTPPGANSIPSQASVTEFVAFDHAPMTFIYRLGEVDPPSSLDDLLSPRFKGSVALQDPRTSSPGLQFFLWVLSVKGVEEGFKFFEALRPNIHIVSSGWSGAYGAFSKGQALIAFSYATSPVYHWTEENNRSYQPAVFPEGHPVQTEYLAVPAACVACENAEKFVQFILRPENQAIVMKKNFMFPVVESVKEGTLFEQIPRLTTIESTQAVELLKDRAALFERWQALGL